MATFLDPCYKNLPFLDAVSKRRMIEHVKDDLLMLEDNDSNEPPKPTAATEQEEAACQEPLTKKHRSLICKLLGDLLEEERQCYSLSDKVSNEIELYKAEKPAELQTLFSGDLYESHSTCSCADLCKESLHL